MSKNLAIIPARGGSKGIKNKNIVDLCGKPLISYTIEAAVKSNQFSKIIVSTDSVEIAEISKEYGAEIPFIRPKELSTDTSRSQDVILHALNFFTASQFDTFCLLQPTSPLRSFEDIKNAYSLYIQKKAYSVVSVCEMEHSPLLSNVINKDLDLSNFISDDIKNSRRQDLPVYYRVNGALYIATVERYKKYKDFYFDRAYAYIMEKEKSVDIDDGFDLKMAEFLIKEGFNENKKDL